MKRLITIASIFVAPLAFGALGERVETLAKDVRLLSAQRTAADVQKLYSVQTLTTDSNDLREYIDGNGIIFALSWKGLDHPDLSVILGNYYTAYETQAKKAVKKKGMRSQEFSGENWVVQKWGQMRNLQGRAYDPSLIPNGVSLDEIL